MFSADDLDLLQLHHGVQHAILTRAANVGGATPSTIVLEALGRARRNDSAECSALPFHFLACAVERLPAAQRIVIIVPRFGREYGGVILDWNAACCC